MLISKLALLISKNAPRLRYQGPQHARHYCASEKKKEGGEVHQPIRGPGVRRSRSAETFFVELEHGLLPVPFTPALSVDLFDAYRAWCIGRHRPDAINDFATTLMRECGAHRVTARLRIDDHGFAMRSLHLEPKRYRVFLLGTRPLQAERERRWMQRGAGNFRIALRAWQWRLGCATEESSVGEPSSARESGEGGGGYPNQLNEPSPNANA